MENVNEKNYKKKVILVICIVLCVLLLGLGSYFLFIKQSDSGDVEDENHGVYYSKMYIYEYVSTKDKTKKALFNGDAYGDWEETSNIYYYYCSSHVCNILDDAYPNVAIRDAYYIKLYNVLTKEEKVLLTTDDFDNSESGLPINSVQVSDITLVYEKDKVYGLICNAVNNKFFYSLDTKEKYMLDNKYDYGFKNDIIDNRIWADEMSWVEDENGMWEGGRYVVDYKQNKILYDFGETENGYPKLLMRDNKYYYASRNEVNQLSPNAYNEIFNKSFKSLLKKTSPDSFVIDSLDNNGNLNILYNNEVFKLDDTGKKTIIKKFDKENGTIIGFNYENSNAIAIKDNSIALLNSENKVTKTIIDDYRPTEYKNCNYEGSEAYFSMNVDNEEIVDIGFLWVCGFDDYNHITYNITKDKIEKAE